MSWFWYYRNKKSRSENSRNSQGCSGEEDEKRCRVCLEDFWVFEPKETVMLAHPMQTYVSWRVYSSKGQCPLCRFIILKLTRRDYWSSVSSDLAGDMTVNDLFTLEFRPNLCGLTNGVNFLCTCKNAFVGYKKIIFITTINMSLMEL